MISHKTIKRITLVDRLIQRVRAGYLLFTVLMTISRSLLKIRMPASLIMLFSIGFLDGWTAFGLWLLSLSLILVGLGNVRTESAPHGSRAMVGIGLFFTIISIAVLGIILQWFTPLTAFALLIVLIGLGILGMSIKRPKSTT